MVMMEYLVPKAHLFRMIGAAIDFSLIRAFCQSLYCKDNGITAAIPRCRLCNTGRIRTGERGKGVGKQTPFSNGPHAHRGERLGKRRF